MYLAYSCFRHNEQLVYAQHIMGRSSSHCNSVAFSMNNAVQTGEKNEMALVIIVSTAVLLALITKAIHFLSYILILLSTSMTIKVR